MSLQLTSVRRLLMSASDSAIPMQDESRPLVIRPTTSRVRLDYFTAWSL